MIVNLSKALKEKKRIAGKINKLEAFICNNNVFEIENPGYTAYKVTPKRDVLESFEMLKKLKEKMAEIKTSIAKANAEHGICGFVYAMEEAKSEICFLNKLNRTVSPLRFDEPNGMVFIEHGYQITAEECEKRIESLQETIDKLQDQIDEINATVKVRIPD